MDVNISWQGKKCLVLFRQLIVSLQDENNPYLEQISRLALEDELGRFKVWAGNIGALQTGRSSLDHRLRDVHFVKVHIVKLLEGLSDSLSQAREVTTQQRKPYDEDEDSERRGSISSSEESLSTDSLESFSSQDELPALATTELQDRYLAIVETIDRLYKQSIAIRSPALRNKTSKAASFIERDEDGEDASARFEAYVIERIKKTYPEAASFLAARLGRAVSQRRRQFMYEKSRRKRQSISLIPPEIAALPSPPQEESAVNSKSSDSRLTSTTSSYEGVMHLPAPSTVITGRASDYTATTFEAPDDDSDHGRSFVSTSTSSTEVNEIDIEIPPPPEGRVAGKDFECPYCCTIIPAKYGNSRTWKKHVLKDLQPFVCTHEDCATPDQLFDSREDWLQHVRWNHAVEWCCDAADHGLRIFSNQNLHKAHMRSHHAATFTEEQLPALSEKAKRPSLVPFQSCPLCTWLPSPEAQTKTAQDEIAERNHIRLKKDRFYVDLPSEELQKHIDTHLCKIAVIALPWREDLQTKNSSTGFTSRKSFNDLSLMSNVSLHFEDTGPDEDFIADEDVPETADCCWNWIPRSANKSYEGHAFDLVLKPLVELNILFPVLLEFLDSVVNKLNDGIIPPNEAKRLASLSDSLKETLQTLDGRHKQKTLGDTLHQRFQNLTRSSGTLTPEGKYLSSPTGDSASTLAQLYSAMDKLLAKLKLPTSSRSTALGKKIDNYYFYLISDEFDNLLSKMKSFHNEINSLSNRARSEQSAPIGDPTEALPIKTKRENQVDESERIDIEHWLSPFDFSSRQESFLARRSPGSGIWFLNHMAFNRWISGQLRYLRFYGPPGSGKTMLASIVINELQKRFSSQTTPVIYLYLDYKESMINTLEKLLGNLLKQLIQLRNPGSVPEELKVLYQRAKGSKQDLRLGDIHKMLQMQLMACNRVYLVVDALDECTFRQNLLVELRKLRSDKISLLITSRTSEEDIVDSVDCDICDGRDIKIYYRCGICSGGKFSICHICKENGLHCLDKKHKLFEPYGMVRILTTTPNNDLDLYLKLRIRDEVRRGTALGRASPVGSGFSSKIASVIIKKADGLFLYAVLCFELLKAMATTKRIKQMLESLPADLHGVCDVAMEQIGKPNNAAVQALGLKVLSRMICAHRPLSLAELRHVLMMKPQVIESEYLNDESILRSTCGLISIDEDERAVRFAHLSVQEYLEDSHITKKWFSEGKIEMALACLATLSDNYHSNSDPFMAYAVRFWGLHVRAADSDPGVQAIAIRLINNSEFVNYILIAWAQNAGPAGWDVSRNAQGLHICAWLGLSSIISDLDTHGFGVDIRETIYGRTPLMYACRQGHANVVRQLLRLGASVNVTGEGGQTALFEAARRNHEDVVDLLTETKELHVNAVCPSESNRTALMLAAHQGHSAVVATLLKHPDIQVNQQDAHGFTALILAVTKGSFAAVTALLQKPDTNLDLVDHADGKSALILAAERNDREMVDVLLQKGADPMVRDRRGGGTALLRAVDLGLFGVSETMLQHGVPIDCADDDGRNPLHSASLHGWGNVVQLLLDHGAAINAQDVNGTTPLHDASHDGRHDVCKILLDAGADPARRDHSGKTPLHCTSMHGWSNLIRFLVEHGADINARDSNGSTPLHDASQHGRHEASRVLLLLGADPRQKDNFGMTPADLASEYGHMEMYQADEATGGDTLPR